MIDREHELPVVRQCELLNLARSTAYYEPAPVPEADLALMRHIDELHLKWPFLGSRRLRDLLNADGFEVGRKHVASLMRRMGIAAIYRKPKTSTPGRARHTGSIRTCSLQRHDPEAVELRSRARTAVGGKVEIRASLAPLATH